MKEDGLGESLEALRTTLQASGVVGTWEWSVPDNHVLLDRNAAELLAGDPGLAQQALTVDRAKALVHPADRVVLFQKMREVGRDGGPIVVEHRVVGADGGIRRILSRGHIAPEPGGGSMRGRGILIDVTECRTSLKAIAPVSGEAADPLHRIIDHCLAARGLLDGATRSHIRLLLDMALLECGQELARRGGLFESH
ncbi:PAS domain-containing protein [Methylobacterium organophilum]|uniref:PAS fold-3 domain-containing protein n=1 Tax=Methylobacterium organophilum TaxID=410 RepID=A0ABQ4TF74_METOR|nr:PAS domain-containing protein [Methylobacterium organophilum]GJE29684.1 hypothetical protein LKMONMHP_4568 [Methylobacterium organophilum]